MVTCIVKLEFALIPIDSKLKDTEMFALRLFLWQQRVMGSDEMRREKKNDRQLVTKYEFKAF